MVVAPSSYFRCSASSRFRANSAETCESLTLARLPSTRLTASKTPELFQSSGCLEALFTLEECVKTLYEPKWPFALDMNTCKARVNTSVVSESAITVDYTAQPSGSLLALGPRDDDPVHGVAIYTDSEPDRGDAWLVAKHDPADRALWSVELTLPADKDGFANGARVSDEMAGGNRVIRYALDKPLPTYLMAFAAGDLVRDDRTTGRVPIAVWHSAGLTVDSNAQLDAVATALAPFANPIGPYT